MKAKVAQLCPTLCDPMDCIVHGILQARIPEWVAFPFSRGSSQPRDQTQVSRIAGRFFAHGKKSCLARGPQLWEQSGDRNLLLGYSRFHQVSRQHIIIIP